MMEVKVKDVRSLNMLVEALSINGYYLETAALWKQFPEGYIDCFVVRIKEAANV